MASSTLCTATICPVPLSGHPLSKSSFQVFFPLHFLPFHITSCLKTKFSIFSYSRPSDMMNVTSASHWWSPSFLLLLLLAQFLLPILSCFSVFPSSFFPSFFSFMRHMTVWLRVFRVLFRESGSVIWVSQSVHGIATRHGGSYYYSIRACSYWVFFWHSAIFAVGVRFTFYSFFTPLWYEHCYRLRHTQGSSVLHPRWRSLSDFFWFFFTHLWSCVSLLVVESRASWYWSFFVLLIGSGIDALIYLGEN